MKGKRWIFLSVLLIASVLLAGCWNYREINTMAIVIGFAVDQFEEGGYEVTVEIMNPVSKGREVQMTPVVVWMEGASIFDAVRNLVTRIGKKLYWSHAKVVIISEEIAEGGILQVLDWVYRDHEVRPDMNVVIARGCLARDILLGDAVIENSVTLQIDHAFRAETVVSQFIELDLWEMMKKILEDGATAMTATVNLVESEGKQVPQLYGTAVFRQGKMVGWLNGEESRITSWLYGVAQRGLIIHKERERGGNIIYELKNSSIQYTALYRAGELSFDVAVKAETQIAELNRTNPDYSKQAILEVLEHNLEKYLEDQMYAVFKKVQKEYRSDIFGLGAKTKNQIPQVWRKIESQWGEMYPQIAVRFRVDVEIVATSLMSKPVFLEE